jgi:septum site-determining protein MinC
MYTDLNQNVKHNAIQFKGGLYTLTTLNILDNNLSLLDNQLKEKISQAPNFFFNAPIIIDLKMLNARDLPIDLSGLKKVLLKNNFILVGLKNASLEQKVAAEALGIAILRPSNSSKEALDVKPTKKSVLEAKEDKDKPVQQSLVITQPVRSGEQVFSPHGDLIILSSVSNGAELLAEGHIHVYGTMRGRALAGINGNKEARIFCKSLEAELVSIAGEYQVSEDIEKKVWKVPAMIAIKEGRLQILGI